MKFDQMVYLFRFGAKRDDQAVDTSGAKMLAIRHLPLIALLALGDNDIVILLPCDGLDAVDRLGKEVVIDIAHDDANGFAPPALQALGNGIGLIVVLAGISHDCFLRLLTDLMAAP